MTEYFTVSIGSRIVRAALTGLLTLLGMVGTAFLGLAALDGGSELSPIAGYGLGLASPFVAALLIAKPLARGPRYWPTLFIGLGAATGTLLTMLLEPHLPGYPWNHHPLAAAMYFALPSFGAFVGTYGRVRRRAENVL
jgi:drug/metabolite transporter (DMT)-like permease